jgi:hypothetical protein
MSSPLWHEGTHRCSSRRSRRSRLGVSKVEEPPGVSEEPPASVEEEEEPPPTSLQSHPMNPPPGVREEQWCGGGYSFPPPTYGREEERCDDGWSFPSCGARKEERCGLREKQTSHSYLRPACSRAPNAC